LNSSASADVIFKCRTKARKYRKNTGLLPKGEEYEFHFGGTGFSDFFEQLFGSRMRGNTGGFGSRGGFADDDFATRGRDIEGDIMVTLEEVFHGSKRTVSLRRSTANKVEKYQVKIPRGVHEGQRIRLAGQGEAGATQPTPHSGSRLCDHQRRQHADDDPRDQWRECREGK
jgi:DnaJ-class molecular chaperone